MEYKSLEEAKLPDIYFCPDHLDVNAAKRNGYTDFNVFLLGGVQTGSISWIGNSKEEFSYENITEQLFPKIRHQHIDGFPVANWIETDMNMVFHALNGFCLKVQMNTSNIPESSLFSAFTFSSTKHIYIADTDSSPYYMLDIDSMQGDPIEPDITAKFEKYYSIELEEVHWLKESGECMDYGDEERFESFADCVANEHEKIFKPTLGCTIPWLSAPQDEKICNTKLNGTGKYYGSKKDLLRDHVDRIIKTDILEHTNACLKPCLQLRSYSKLKHTNTANFFNYNRLELVFKKTVRVTKYLKAYNEFDLVVEIGSSMGLWIGLSVVGVLDLVLVTANDLRRRITGN